MKQGISGVVIAYNESIRIAACIEGLKQVCDEVIVVDSYSTDDTVDIAKSLGCSVFQHAFEGHIEQKNWAQGLSNYTWVLSLDADEILSDGLIAWLKEFRNTTVACMNGDSISSELLAERDQWNTNSDINRDCIAWSFPRLNHLGERPIKGCGWYPDRKIRLWRFGEAAWGGINPHDKIEVHSSGGDDKVRVGACNQNILHFTYNSYSEIGIQAMKFATIGGRALQSTGEKRVWLWAKILVSPCSRWIKNYLMHGGFLYGKDGWVICYWQFMETFHKYRFALINK